MNKNEFLFELSGRLDHLPEEEALKTINYYSEMIDDRIEDGESEEAAVSAIGSIDDIVLEASGQGAEPKSGFAKLSRGTKALIIVLIILSSVIWLPVAAGIFGVLVGVAATVISVIISLFAICLSFALSAVGLIAVTPIYIYLGKPFLTALAFSSALILAGLAIILFIISVFVTKKLWKFVRFLFRKTIELIKRKGRAK